MPPTHRCIGGIFVQFFAHFVLMQIQRACPILYCSISIFQRSKKAYESKGHRFESCWVHHEPLTSFALSAVVFLPAFCAGFFFYLVFELSHIIKSREGFS